MNQQQQHRQYNEQRREREDSDGTPPPRGLGDARDLSNEINHLLNGMEGFNYVEFLRHTPQPSGQ